jgi:hypothetical protein
MDRFLLKDSINTLQCLKVELQGKVEERDIQLLDTVIEDLLALDGHREIDAESALRMLVLLAEVIAKIPSIAASINMMVQAVFDAASH